MYQLVNQAKQNKVNPMELFGQVTKDYTPEQMDRLFTQAKSMGFPEEIIEKVQNNEQ